LPKYQAETVSFMNNAFIYLLVLSCQKFCFVGYDNTKTQVQEGRRLKDHAHQDSTAIANKCKMKQRNKKR
jgi:hypothetical protein